jgi:hypothetical protein
MIFGSHATERGAAFGPEHEAVNPVCALSAFLAIAAGFVSRKALAILSGIENKDGHDADRGFS